MAKRKKSTAAWKKYLIAGWSFMECLLFSGVLYGWSSLVFVLKEEGIYADLCSTGSHESDKQETAFNTTVVSNFTLSLNNQSEANYFLSSQSGSNNSMILENVHIPCKEQDSMLALCFTIGSSVFCASCVVMGHINYRLGTRITRLIACAFFVVGSLCLALVNKVAFILSSATAFNLDQSKILSFGKELNSNPDFPWLIFPGLSCIGVGGLPLLVTNTQVSNLFDKDRSTVVGLLVGGYDMSSVIFLVVKLAHQNGLSRRYMYFILTGCHSMTLVSTFLFLPRGFITFSDTRRELELTVNAERKISDKLLQSERRMGRRPSLADPQSLSSYIKQPMFISHLLWVCLLQLRFYYFLGNLNTYLNRLLKEDKTSVSHYTDVCFYIMMCGLVTSFVAGIVYDRQKTLFLGGRTKLYRSLMPAILPMMLASFLAIILSILVLLSYTVLLYPMFVTLTLFRSFLYALVTAFISAVFPSEFFAMLYGITIVSAGLFSCLQYAFFQWAESYDHAPFHADVFLLCVSVVSIIHPIYMWIACRREESSDT